MKPITQRIFNLLTAYGPGLPDHFKSISTLLSHSEEWAEDPVLADMAIDEKEYFEFEGVRHSLFTLACRVGNFRVMRLLHEHELVVGKTAEPKIQTALWLAAMHSHYSVAEYLIELGFELNSPSLRETEVIEPLYAKAVTINSFSFPLTAAAQRLDYRMLMMLLVNHANVSVQEILNLDPELLNAARRRSLAELQQNLKVSEETSRKGTLTFKAKEKGLTAHELVEFQEDSEQKKKCLQLFEAKLNLDKSLGLTDMERKGAFTNALIKDTHFVTYYLAFMAKAINAKLNGQSFLPEYDKVDFLRFALIELCRACEDNSKVVTLIHESLIAELMPAKCGEVDISPDEGPRQVVVGIFVDLNEKDRILKKLGAKTEFSNTFFAPPPVAAPKAPELLPAAVVPNPVQLPQPTRSPSPTL